MSSPLFHPAPRALIDPTSDDHLARWGAVPHLVSRHRRTTNSTGTTATTAATSQPVVRLSGPVRSGRLYMIKFQSGFICSATAIIGVQCAFTINGQWPTVSSSRLGIGYVSVGSAVTETKPIEFFHSASADYTLAIMIAHWRQGGSGTATLQGSADLPMDLSIMDMGPDTGAAGGANL